MAVTAIPGLSCGGNVWDETVAQFKDRYQCHVVPLAGFAGQPAIGEPFLERVRDGLIGWFIPARSGAVAGAGAMSSRGAGR